MEDQNDSWFKISRSILHHPIWIDCPASWLRVWIALLALANWAPRQRRFGGDEITVQPGQVICSVEWLKVKCNISVKQTRAALDYLKTANSIAIKTASHGTLITITNWERYQGREWYEGQAKQQAEGQAGGKPRASQGQTKGNASRRVEPSTPDSSGKPPEESSAFLPGLEAAGNGTKPKREKKVKNPRHGNPGWPEWKWRGWCDLFKADPICQKASGAKEDYGFRVGTEEDAKWLAEAHARSNRKSLDPKSDYSPGFGGWLKSALNAREVGQTIEGFNGAGRSRPHESEIL